VINIAQNDPGIFRAYNPAEAIKFLTRTGDYAILGGILLAITGVEALFADLGHYNRQSIQWTFALVVYPSLVIAYLGQAAALEVHPEWISNTFYNSIPGGPGSVIYWIVFVLATLATIIASQAMILATFSIVFL
jgi:KUP system potassium uptake protein